MYFPFDDKCSATGEGQRGLCEANNNHPVLGDKGMWAVLFCFFMNSVYPLNYLFFPVKKCFGKHHCN